MDRRHIAEGPHEISQIDLYDAEVVQGPLYLWWRTFLYHKTTKRIFVSSVLYDWYSEGCRFADCVVPEENAQEAAEWFANLIGAATGCEVIIKGERP